MNIIAKAKANKPAFGANCNGCGYCCMSEVCKLGVRVFGADVLSPCPGLIKDVTAGNYRCALVLAEKEAEMEPKIASALAIGKGCDAETHEEICS